MKNLLLFLILLVFTGCVSTKTPHDFTQANADVNAVTIADVHSHAQVLEEHYWKYAQHEGIIWPPRRSSDALENPDMHGNGGDSALFTGYMLASAVYKYKTTNDPADLEKALRTLRGCYILTHATGTPGVVSRCAFDASKPEVFGYPEWWGSRIQRGFVGTGPAHQGANWVTTYPPMTYYTRATRDQISGLLFGLGVAWKELDGAHPDEVMARAVIREITENVYWHLRNNDFKIVDQHGRNDTSADDVTGTLKLQLFAVYRHTSGRARIQEKYEDQFQKVFLAGRFWETVNLFSNVQQYYAWNLRYARAYTTWILEDDPARKETIRNYVRSKLWAYTYNHNCPFFAFCYAAMNDPGTVDLEDAMFGLKSLTLKPIREYDSPLCGDVRAPQLEALMSIRRFVVPPHLRKPTDYSTWTKRPWDVGEHCLEPGQLPNGNTTGGDFLLPYWPRYSRVILPFSTLTSLMRSFSSTRTRPPGVTGYINLPSSTR
jgi:hypothetical protein